MKLYDVPNNSTIDVEHLNLATEDGEKIKEMEFCHVDGAYSLCYWKDVPIHLSASTEVYLKAK